MAKTRNGAQGRNRTSDTRIFNPLLYRLSYLGMRFRASETALYGVCVAMSRGCDAQKSNFSRARAAPSTLFIADADSLC